ncbi:hypothetical protein JCM5296_005229 [Sporobolomyces johnsonii]
MASSTSSPPSSPRLRSSSSMSSLPRLPRSQLPNGRPLPQTAQPSLADLIQDEVDHTQSREHEWAELQAQAAATTADEHLRLRRTSSAPPRDTVQSNARLGAMASSATSAVPPSAVFLPPHYGRPGRPSSPDVFGTLLRPVIQSLSRPGSPGQPRSSPPTQPSALPGPSAPLSPTHAHAPALFVDPPSPERSHTSLPAQFPPREPTDPAPTVESQGFVLYIGSLVAYVVFLVWALVPEKWLEWIGVEWYPMREWALLVPSWIVMLVVYIYAGYFFLNMSNTPPLDEGLGSNDPLAFIPPPPASPSLLASLPRSTSKRNASLTRLYTDSILLPEDAIPPLYDLPLDVVGRVLYGDRAQAFSHQPRSSALQLIASRRPTVRHTFSQHVSRFPADETCVLLSLLDRLALPLAIFLAVSSAAVLVLLAVVSTEAYVLQPRASHNALPAYISDNLGPYTPWYAVGTYETVPDGCELTQAHILMRHGARFPTSNADKRMKTAITKVKNATSLTSDLEFARAYTFTLGTDDLTPLGARESYQAGQQAYSRYSMLTKQGSIAPFTRSDSQQRVVDSATNWTAGFFENRRIGRTEGPVVIDRTAGSNDTLDDNNCPNAPSTGAAYTVSYLSLFASNATARLNAAAPGSNLTTSDVLALMQLCAFESQFRGVVSRWCGLFTEDEWERSKYYYDLGKYYANAYGNSLGPVQGVGYVNELLTRLTGNRAYVERDETQVNHTLDNNPTTFPLNRTLYADFTHDTQMSSILSAIGLKSGPSLPASGPPAGQTWLTNQIVPFAGRLTTERMKCGNVEYLRFFLNDQLQVPTFCAGADAATGLCSLRNFVASQRYARNSGDGDYLKCGYTPIVA